MNYIFFTSIFYENFVLQSVNGYGTNFALTFCCIPFIYTYLTFFLVRIHNFEFHEIFSSDEIIDKEKKWSISHGCVGEVFC